MIIGNATISGILSSSTHCRNSTILMCKQWQVQSESRVKY